MWLFLIALMKQLQQEQDLLQQFQEKQENKLLTLHDCEKQQADEGVEKSKRELERQVSIIKAEKRLLSYSFVFSSCSVFENGSHFLFCVSFFGSVLVY